VAIRVPVLLDISGDADVDFDRAITRQLRSVDTGSAGDRLGRDFGNGFDRGASSTLGQALTQQGSAIARIGSVASGLVGALVPIGPSLAGVAAGALAVAGAVGQASVAALAAGGVFASLGQGFAAVQVGSAGVSDAITAQAAAQAELAATGEIAESTQQQLTAAMDGLAPAARNVVGVVGELTPAWSAFQNSVQQELFRGLAGELSALSDSILPNLTTNLSGTAAILNDAAQAFSQFIVAGGGAGQINTIMAGLNDTLAAILPAFGNIGAGLLTLFEGSIGSATQLAESISAVTDGFAGWAEGVVQSGALADALDMAMSTMGSLIGIVTNLGSILISVLGAGADEGASLLASFEAATGQLAAFLQTASAQAGLQQFYDLITQVGETVSILGAVAGPIFTGIASLLSVLIPIVTQLRTALEPVITALAVNLSTAVQGLAPVIGVVLGVVAQLIGLLAPLVTLILGALGPALAEIGRLFSQNLSPAITGLVTLLQPLIGIFLEIFGAQVVNAITLVVDVLGGVFDILGGLITFLTGVFTGDWEQAWDGLTQVADGVVTILTGIVRFLWRTIQNYFRNGGAEVIAAVRNWWNGVLTSFTNFQARIITGVISWVARLIGRFLAMRDRAIATVRGLWSVAQSLFSLGVRTVASTARAGLDNVVGFFRDLPSRIGRAIGDLGQLLYQAGRNVVQGLINGIQAMIGSLAGAASNLAGTIRDYLPFSPAKVGPLSGTGNPENSGRQIAQLVADGILANVNAPANAMTRALQPLVAPATAARTGVQGAGVGDNGVTVNQIFNGPTTSGGRLNEITWNIRYATQARTEVVDGVAR
jgi:phage-related protein